MNYFKVDDLGDGIWRISEKSVVREYLIIGSEKALLIDTGYAYGGRSFLNIIHRITTLPLIVVNTHFHPDHSGKSHLFDEVYIGKGDVPSDMDKTQLLLISIKKKQPIKGSLYLKLKWRPKIKTKYIPVTGDTKFELGGRKVEVLEFPGHTPGSIMLLDEMTKTVFSNDAANVVTWLFTNPNQKLKDYAKRLHLLSEDLIKRGYKNIRFSHIDEKFDMGFYKEFADFIDALKISDTEVTEIKDHAKDVHVGSMNSVKYGKLTIAFYKKQFEA